MKHKTNILFLVVISAILISLATPTFAGTAYSPKKTKIKIWEPMEYDLEHASGDALIAQVTGAKDQGYGPTAARWFDDQRDGGVEQCARSRWNVLADDSGITLVDTHGNTDFVVAATGKYEDELKGWEDWQGNGSTDANIDVGWWSQESVWTADVKDGWFDNNWKTTHDANRTITYITSCYSSSLLDNVGGRVRFGYTGTIDCPNEDIDTLFARMNGTEDDGEKRKAGEAYGNGTEYEDGFTKAGENDTTLCPAPVSWEPKGTGAGQSGTGKIVFDTHCDNTQAATSALTREILKGIITISNYRWNNDYELKFDYNTNDCDEDYKVEMTAVANHVKAKDGGQKLDGSKVAPNADSKEWTFED